MVLPFLARLSEAEEDAANDPRRSKQIQAHLGVQATKMQKIVSCSELAPESLRGGVRHLYSSGNRIHVLCTFDPT